MIFGRKLTKLYRFQGDRGKSEQNIAVRMRCKALNFRGEGFGMGGRKKS